MEPEPLKVQMVNFYPKDNSRESHTEAYDLVNLPEGAAPVLRRGANFYFCVRFDRGFDQKVDRLRVVFDFGPKPTVSRGTTVGIPLRPNQDLPEDPQVWGLRLDRQTNNNDVVLQVHIAPDAPVGIWTCFIHTHIKGRPSQNNKFRCDDDIYVLFNPWCPLDCVYMENEEELKEYILNESGKIWCGTYKNPRGRRWIFGQFDDISLPSAVYLLERSGLDHSNRGSAILTCRSISAMINSLDDDGVLEGRWDGNYKDGVSPHAWTGSALIMDRYLRSGGKPVKYGQCWVFSAVVVTICRALGIPCRSTTNYVSAHDTDRSLTIDKFFDKAGNRIEGGPKGNCLDSCWNFHVWNDVWMARPDLPPGYGGWQIIDSTPQEPSYKRYRCGPASVEAVRKGDICYVYDTPFVFSEVNADICHFQEDDDSDYGFVKMSVNKYMVGRSIVTKRVDKDDDDGDSDLWDVTSLYKNPEGTQSERLAVYNAIRGNIYTSPLNYDEPRDLVEDVEFDLVDIDVVTLGRSFDVVVNIVNKAQERRTITAVLTADSVYYNGVSKNFLKREQGTFTLNPGQKEQLKTRVEPREYLDKLTDHNLVKIYAMANVQETKQTWSEEDDFSLFKPQIKLRVLDENPKVGTETPIEFSFQNPLEESLTVCSYTLQGLGVKNRTVRFGDVEPRGMVTFTEVFTAKCPGTKKIVAIFNSKQIDEINGSCSYNVTE